MENKYITVGELYGELLVHPMLQDLTIERVATYAVEFCRKWGANVLFEEKVVKLQADNYRVVLPCDFYELIAIRDLDSKINYRYSTDVFHYSDEKLELCEGHHSDLTYKLNGNVIFLSTKDNMVEVVYNAIATDDEEGYPKIYDDATYIQALKDYIKLQCFTVLFDCGKINQNVYQNAQQQYGFSVRVLRTHLAIPTPDKVESLANILNSMIIHRGHFKGYIDTGNNTKFKVK